MRDLPQRGGGNPGSLSPRDPGSSARREGPSREGGPVRSQGLGIQRRASGGEAWWGSHMGKSKSHCEVRNRQTWGHGFLLHLLVKVDALGAEDTAVGGRWGLETGIEARERPREGRVSKVS